MPRFRNVVAPAPDWYGKAPVVPPARFVAVPAVLADPALPAVVAKLTDRPLAGTFVQYWPVPLYCSFVDDE